MHSYPLFWRISPMYAVLSEINPTSSIELKSAGETKNKHLTEFVVSRNFPIFFWLLICIARLYQSNKFKILTVIIFNLLNSNFKILEQGLAGYRGSASIHRAAFPLLVSVALHLKSIFFARQSPQDSIF